MRRLRNDDGLHDPDGLTVELELDQHDLEHLSH
jgi:hypothetical protein